MISLHLNILENMLNQIIYGYNMTDKEKLKLFTSIINLLRAHRDNISPEIVDIILAAVEERPTDG